MGTRTLTTCITQGYNDLWTQAMEVLVRKQAHDGINPVDRMVIQLQQLYAAGNYSRVLKTKGVRRKFDLTQCVPSFQPPVEITEFKRTRTVGMRVEFAISDLRESNDESLEGLAYRVLTGVRYDLMQKHYFKTAPDAAQVALAGFCFTAAMVSRRWKPPFGIELFALAGG